MNDVRISREADFDPRHYRFARNTNARRDEFRDPVPDVLLRYRWVAIVVLVVALALAGFTACGIPNC